MCGHRGAANGTGMATAPAASVTLRCEKTFLHGWRQGRRTRALAPLPPARNPEVIRSWLTSVGSVGSVGSVSSVAANARESSKAQALTHQHGERDTAKN